MVASKSMFDAAQFGAERQQAAHPEDNTDGSAQTEAAGEKKYLHFIQYI